MPTDVSSGKSDNQLLGFGAFRTWLGHNKLIQSFHRALKAGKLHHRVGDLTSPQGDQAFVETGLEKKKQHRFHPECHHTMIYIYMPRAD